MQVDTRWNKLLYAPELLKFYLNSFQDSLPSSSNLKTWTQAPFKTVPNTGVDITIRRFGAYDRK